MDYKPVDHLIDPIAHTDKLAKYSAVLTEFCGDFIAHIIIQTLIFVLLLLAILVVLFIPSLINLFVS